MRAPSFWWQKTGLWALWLSPLAGFYALIAGWRIKQAGAKASVPVICIGNLVVGGAGKTPTALRVADALINLGKRPVFLSRGYGGRLAGPVRVDPSIHRSVAVGDEALLLASVAPTVIARDRAAGAAYAAQFGDVIVMDDGLQNPSLIKDFSIAVVDAGQGIGNGWCLPSGPLRAPLAAQLSKIDACLFIGDDFEKIEPLARRLRVPVYYGRLKPDSRQADGFNGLKSLAFAGIGRPEKFFETLAQTGAILGETCLFADHYRYQKSEIEALLAQAEAQRLVPVTTTKDAVKIREIAPELMQSIRVLDVSLTVESFDNLLNQMMKKIA
jgi:tetraacyldisaccharide 4'-kinase